MKNTSVFVLVVALGSAAIYACAGPNAGEAVFTDGESTAPSKKKDAGGSSGTEEETSSSSTSGAPAGGDEFFKTAFAYQSPGVKASTVAAHGGAVEGDGTAAAAPKNCITAGCHEGGANPFSAGGSIFTAATGGKATGGKFEIGINKPDGTSFATAYADEDGNFWIDTAGPIPDGSKVAIRKEGGKSTAMATLLTAANKGGGCNAATGCHGGASLRIYAP